MLDLHVYRWKKRVLLVFAPSRAGAALTQQQQWLAEHLEGCVERDLEVGYVIEQGAGVLGARTLSPADVARLRTRFDVPSGEIHVLLVGKDGGVKLRADRLVAPQELFALIDAMPMRQQEQRTNRGGDRSGDV